MKEHLLCLKPPETRGPTTRAAFVGAVAAAAPGMCCYPYDAGAQLAWTCISVLGATQTSPSVLFFFSFVFTSRKYWSPPLVECKHFHMQNVFLRICICICKECICKKSAFVKNEKLHHVFLHLCLLQIWVNIRWLYIYLTMNSILQCQRRSKKMKVSSSLIFSVQCCVSVIRCS